MAKSGPKFTLNNEIQQTICAFILAGAYPHIAAEAAGIPRHVFDLWMKRGEMGPGKPGSKAKSRYTPFWLAVMQARAQARLNAEMAAMKEQPVKWLMQGPGKERPNDPGWSQQVRPIIHEKNQTVNLLLAPEMQSMFASILQILAPYPEARALIAQALAGKTPRPVIPLPNKPDQTP